MSEYLSLYSKYFYIPILRDVLSLTAFVIALIKIRKDSTLSIFKIYLFWGAIGPFLNITLLNSQGNRVYYNFFDSTIDYVNYLFSLIEPFTYYFYINKIINRKSKLISVLFKSYALLNLFLLFKYINIPDTQKIFFALKLYLCGMTLILFLSYKYYKFIFKEKPYLNLVKEPSFWVVSGITFTITCLIPTLILSIRSPMGSVIFKYAYSLITLFYSFNILMLIKAFLCNQEKKNQLYSL